MIPRSRKLDRILEGLSCPKGLLEIWAQDTRHPDRSSVCLVRRNNLLVNNFRTQVVHALAGDLVGRSISSIQLGSSGVTEQVTDTLITNPYSVVTTSSVELSPKTNLFVGTLGMGSGDQVEFREVGLIFANSTLAARKTFPTMIKSYPWEWTIRWTILWT